MNNFNHLNIMIQHTRDRFQIFINFSLYSCLKDYYIHYRNPLLVMDFNSALRIITEDTRFSLYVLFGGA